MSFTASGKILDLFSLTIMPVIENVLSASVEAAGIHIVFKANRYKFGKSNRWENHQSYTLKLSEEVFSGCKKILLEKNFY